MISFFVFSQIAIAVLGAGAAWLSQDPRPEMSKWACVLGALGQPFWFYSFFVSDQWGSIAVSVLYTFAWIRGINNNWIKPRLAQK